MQHLAELSSLLQPVGLSNLVEQHILYPGQRRAQLVRAMMKRLLHGLDVDDVSCGLADLPQGMAEDERFAQKCHVILKLLGVTASPEQLRGCSGQQDRDNAPLLQMAHLLAAMEARRAAPTGSRSGSTQAESEQQQQQQEQGVQPEARPAAGDINRVAQLLPIAATLLSKVSAGNTQLFPSDMSDAVRAYSDQGALAQLPALCQQAVQRAQQLQRVLQQVLDAGGSACEGVGREQWQRLVLDLDKALQRQLQETQAFDAVYTQELSVWAGVAHSQQQVPEQRQQWPAQLHGMDPSSAAGSAESTGRMACSLMLAYQELQAVMDCVSTVMQQYQALQDVPLTALQIQRDQHLSAAHSMRMSASAVRRPGI